MSERERALRIRRHQYDMYSQPSLGPAMKPLLRYPWLMERRHGIDGALGGKAGLVVTGEPPFKVMRNSWLSVFVLYYCRCVVSGTTQNDFTVNEGRKRCSAANDWKQKMRCRFAMGPLTDFWRRREGRIYRRG